MCSPNDPITAGVFDSCPAFPACEHYPHACPPGLVAPGGATDGEREDAADIAGICRTCGTQHPCPVHYRSELDPAPVASQADAELPEQFRDIDFVHVRCGHPLSEHRGPTTAEWCEFPAVVREPVEFTQAPDASPPAEGDEVGYVVWALADDFLTEHPPEDGPVEPETVHAWLTERGRHLGARP